MASKHSSDEQTAQACRLPAQAIESTQDEFNSSARRENAQSDTRTVHDAQPPTAIESPKPESIDAQPPSDNVQDAALLSRAVAQLRKIVANWTKSNLQFRAGAMLDMTTLYNLYLIEHRQVTTTRLQALDFRQFFNLLRLECLPYARFVHQYDLLDGSLVMQMLDVDIRRGSALLAQYNRMLRSESDRRSGDIHRRREKFRFLGRSLSNHRLADHSERIANVDLLALVSGSGLHVNQLRNWLACSFEAMATAVRKAEPGKFGAEWSKMLVGESDGEVPNDGLFFAGPARFLAEDEAFPHFFYISTMRLLEQVNDAFSLPHPFDFTPVEVESVRLIYDTLRKCADEMRKAVSIFRQSHIALRFSQMLLLVADSLDWIAQHRFRLKQAATFNREYNFSTAAACRRLLAALERAEIEAALVDFAASKGLKDDAFARIAHAFVEQLQRPMCEITHFKEWLMAQLLVLSRWSGKSAPTLEADETATTEACDGVIAGDSTNEIGTVGIGIGAAFEIANECLQLAFDQYLSRSDCHCSRLTIFFAFVQMLLRQCATTLLAREVKSSTHIEALGHLKYLTTVKSAEGDAVASMADDDELVGERKRAALNQTWAWGADILDHFVFGFTRSGEELGCEEALMRDGPTFGIDLDEDDDADVEMPKWLDGSSEESWAVVQSESSTTPTTLDELLGLPIGTIVERRSGGAVPTSSVVAKPTNAPPQRSTIMIASSKSQRRKRTSSSLTEHHSCSTEPSPVTGDADCAAMPPPKSAPRRSRRSRLSLPTHSDELPVAESGETDGKSEPDDENAVAHEESTPLPATAGCKLNSTVPPQPEAVAAGDKFAPTAELPVREFDDGVISQNASIQQQQETEAALSENLESASSILAHEQPDEIGAQAVNGDESSDFVALSYSAIASTPTTGDVAGRSPPPAVPTLAHSSASAASDGEALVTSQSAAALVEATPSSTTATIMGELELTVWPPQSEPTFRNAPAAEVLVAVERTGNDDESSSEVSTNARPDAQVTVVQRAESAFSFHSRWSTRHEPTESGTGQAVLESGALTARGAVALVVSAAPPTGAAATSAPPLPKASERRSAEVPAVAGNSTTTPKRSPVANPLERMLMDSVFGNIKRTGHKK